MPTAGAWLRARGSGLGAGEARLLGVEQRLDLRHHLGRGQARGDRRKIGDGDRAAGLRALAPEAAGIVHHRNHWQIELAIERDQPGLELSLLVDADAGAFGKDQDRAAARHLASRFRDHRGHRPATAAAVDQDHRRMAEEPAEHRNLAQLLLGDDADVGHQLVEREGLPGGLVVADIDAGGLEMLVLDPLLLQAQPEDPVRQAEDAAGPEPDGGAGQPGTLQQRKRRDERALEQCPNPEKHVEQSRSDDQHPRPRAMRDVPVVGSSAPGGALSGGKRSM
ncbi:hypothetical protein SDC9_28796 [bioreactor metagenome]|uniref:Uncharacterized protein n=1 Tax=bioreactor metagenome TaxID=1076179 RepID=A0A644UV29_9ZZZZ